MTAAERAERSREADARCAAAFDAAGCPDAGVALIAVGGYGREELAPYSDLDVVLVHADDLEPGEWAGQIWYPLWDAGLDIDHAVRSGGDMLAQAGADLRVALGLLDLRHLAGDTNVTLGLRAAVLAQWRRDARSRLPELHELVTSRQRLVGELAHAAIPDLKEAAGGLRDATVLRGLVATWLVDVPHADVERCRMALLDVRDALHHVAGRRTDRVAPEYWPQIAEELGLTDATAAQRHTRSLARRLTHLTRLTWRRADAVLRRPGRGARRPRLEKVAAGVAVSHEEVVIDRGARIEGDPGLLLRAAAEAASRDLVLAPTTAARLVRDGALLPDPWPAAIRTDFLRLIGAGPGLLGVWETLDETGALDALLPEWEQVRLLPHASIVHRFTVDRHLVETCIEAAALVRDVTRPDVLLLAALLHDIGKGSRIPHARAGEPVARGIAERMGMSPDDVDLVGWLVREHLRLADIATTRDVEDPATIAATVAFVGDRERLDLLAALTEADARATSEKAWSSWRAGLVRTLVSRTGAALAHEPIRWEASAEVAVPLEVPSGRYAVEVLDAPTGDGSVVRVVALDRVGLLADIAAALAIARLSVHSARAWPQEVRRDGAVVPIGVSEWIVGEAGLDPAVIRRRLEAIGSGELDPRDRLAVDRRGGPAPVVVLRPDASAEATVLEVRASDHRGLVAQVCRSLAALGLTVRSAHVNTLGAQAVDVFYIQEEFAGVLTDERAASAAHAVRAAL